MTADPAQHPRQAMRDHTEAVRCESRERDPLGSLMWDRRLGDFADVTLVDRGRVVSIPWRWYLRGGS